MPFNVVKHSEFVLFSDLSFSLSDPHCSELLWWLKNYHFQMISLSDPLCRNFVMTEELLFSDNLSDPLFRTFVMTEELLFSDDLSDPLFRTFVMTEELSFSDDLSLWPTVQKFCDNWRTVVFRWSLWPTVQNFCDDWRTVVFRSLSPTLPAGRG